MTGLALAENIRKTRSLKGFSQEYVAESLSVSQKTYSRIENHELSPTFEQLLNLTEILQVSLFKLLSFDDKIVFNNKIENQHSGEFKVYNNTEIEFVVTLYERLLSEKDSIIELLKNNR